MGANSGLPGMEGRTADAGKRTMMEAMMRKQREEQVTNAQRSQREEQVTNAQRSLVNADFRPGLEPDYMAARSQRKQAMMEAMMRKEREEQVTNAQTNNRYSGLENRSNVEAANPTALFNILAKGGISMGPGRSTRYTDEDAQEIMQRAQMAARSQRQMR